MIWRVIYGFTMPKKKNLYLTRSQRKQKLIELEHNAHIKKACLLVMKGLASEYLKSNDNGKFWFWKLLQRKKKYLSMA